MIENIAITAGLLPYSLGVLPASSRRVFVSPETKLSVHRVENIFEVSRALHENRDPSKKLKDMKGTKKERIKTGSPNPCMVVKPFITPKPRAIVMCEYQNFSTESTWTRDSLKDVVVIMVLFTIDQSFYTFCYFWPQTGGYASFDVRELLNKLWCTYMRNPPAFLFFSDHDVHGLHIYQQLKYGCAKSSWASEIMVCPLLQLMGPSREDLLEHHKRNMYQIHKQDLTRIYPGWTAERLDVVVQRDWTKCQAWLRLAMYEITSSTDFKLKAGAERLGILRWDPVLAKELADISNHVNRVCPTFTVNSSSISADWLIKILSCHFWRQMVCRRNGAVRCWEHWHEN